MKGLIRDSYGRAIPGVQLDLHGTASGQDYSAATDVEGIFRLRDVRIGVYEIRLAREGFQTQIIPTFQVSGPVTILELALHESQETAPEARCPSGVPGTPCTAAPGGPATPYPGMPRPASQEASAAVPLEQIPPDSANFSPHPDRWDIAMPEWRRYEKQPDVPYVKSHWYDPFNRNRIKGDYPIFGQRWFFNFTGTSETGFDGRRLPVPSGLNSVDPGSSKFFGRGEQAFVSENLRLSLDLFRGDTSFRPVDFRIRVTPEINLNFLQTRERGIVNIDTRKGTNRFDAHVGLQEAFVEAKLRDLSPNYDFVSVRAGIQQFTSDFRGFLFSEEQPGARIFGNLLSNRLAYNLAWFHLLEKNTNSGLNAFLNRGQQVYVANFYIQDFLSKGAWCRGASWQVRQALSVTCAVKSPACASWQSVHCSVNTA